MSERLRQEIAHAINRVSAENGSDTPDFILAEFLTDSLVAFDKAVHARGQWYGHHCSISGCDHVSRIVELPDSSNMKAQSSVSDTLPPVVR